MPPRPSLLRRFPASPSTRLPPLYTRMRSHSSTILAQQTSTPPPPPPLEASTPGSVLVIYVISNVRHNVLSSLHCTGRPDALHRDLDASWQWRSDVLADLRVNVTLEGSEKVLWFKERFLEDEEIIEHFVFNETRRIDWTMHRSRNGWYIRIRSPAFLSGAFILLISPRPDSLHPPGALLFESRTNAPILHTHRFSRPLTLERVLIRSRSRYEPAHTHTHRERTIPGRRVPAHATELHARLEQAQAAQQASHNQRAPAQTRAPRLAGTHSLKLSPATSPPLLSYFAPSPNAIYATALGGSLFVGNPAFDAAEHDVRDVVAQFGDVESVRFIVNPDGRIPRDLWAARTSRLLHAPLARRVLFVGNMPYGSEETDLREKFTPFGTIIVAEPRGFAHVEFLQEEDAVAAYESFAPSIGYTFMAYRGNEEALRTVLNELRRAYGGCISASGRGESLRSNLTGELTRSGFLEFLSVERATHALTKVGGSVTPYGPINLEYALSREGTRRTAGRQGGGVGTGVGARKAGTRPGTAVEKAGTGGEAEVAVDMTAGGRRGYGGGDY
ncbi:hypothetical protein K438DRAFT_1992659 [Mycena galopus ATCC 62051]|nr:hypothetical protein K438DRAFT_1992659 [Mycena galopus ATCC 62051]